MSIFRDSVLFPILAIAFASAAAAVWFVQLFVVPLSWPVGVAVFAAATISSLGGIVAAVSRSRAAQVEFQRHLADLSQLDTHELSSLDASSAPRGLTKGRWAGITTQCHSTLADLSCRVRDLDTTRSALAIRSRRAVAEAARLRSVLANLGDPVIVVDGYDEVALANEAAQSLFSFNLEDAGQRTAAGLLGCEQLVDLLLATNHRQTDTQRTDEFEIADSDGGSHWFRATARRLRAGAADETTDGSTYSGVVVVLRDIDHEKSLQTRNAEFVSSVSHEMKTPLAGIKAYVELLVDGEADDEETREEFLDIINSQADRLQRLVDNMLNLARIEAGVVSVNKRNRSLNEILDEARGVIQPAAEAKDITLAAELSPLYLGVHADRDMLLQSAINLLSNAVKYTPDGGRVTLRSRSVDQMIVYEVEDTGVGLSPEDCGRVFDKFYRVGKDKLMAQGTGLGLPLAKHIIEDVHGGSLGLESELGTGSRFVATLPTAGQLF